MSLMIQDPTFWVEPAQTLTQSVQVIGEDVRTPGSRSVLDGLDRPHDVDGHLALARMGNLEGGRRCAPLHTLAENAGAAGVGVHHVGAGVAVERQTLVPVEGDVV